MTTFNSGDRYAESAHLRGSVIARLRGALAFAASVIKSGEPWTATCEETINGALKKEFRSVAFVECYSKLTEREKEYHNLMIQGFTNREIAHIMGISPKTSENHRKGVLTKFKMTTTAIVAFSAVNGMLPNSYLYKLESDAKARNKVHERA